jgi:hypothetical protein
MPLLPYEVVSIDSPLAPEDVPTALREHVEARRMMRWSRGEAEFEGEIRASTFDIRRLIGYQNGFLPAIRGTIEPHHPGSRIRVTMSLHPFVLVFLIFWVSSVGTIGVLALIGLVSGSGPGLGVLLPLGMLLFVWALASGAFTVEAGIATRRLIEILGAKSRAA